MNRHLLLSCILLSMLFCKINAQKLERVAQIGGTAGSNPYGFTVAGNKLFFMALNGVTSVGLYVTQGTEGTTELISPPNILPSSFSGWTAFAGKLYFACDDGVNGKELWSSDGTAGGTAMVKDLYPGATGSSPFGLTVMNNKLYFLGKGPSGNARLYVSDGTAGGTFIIWNQECRFMDYLPGFAVLNNEIYFKSGTFYNDLWKSDGSPQGTVLVKAGISPICPGGKYAVLAGKIYFCGSDVTHSAELYVTDGTEAGTYMVKNIYPDQPNIGYGSTPTGFTVFNSRVYFSAIDGEHGEELYATDGTEAGTFLVKDITPGATGSRPAQLIVFNNKLYASCLQSKQLWQSDGTEGGTSMVSTLSDSWYFGAIWNNTIYASPGTLGSYLYKTDGTATGTGIATAENAFSPIYNYNVENRLTVYNGSLYFGGSSAGISDYREPLRLVSTAVTRSFSFIGAGNWSNPGNWSLGNMPPSTLLPGDNVLINENCVLDITVHAQPGSSLTVAAGKNLLVQGGLIIQ